jgi:hypothetical protein
MWLGSPTAAHQAMDRTAAELRQRLGVDTREEDR